MKKKENVFRVFALIPFVALTFLLLGVLSFILSLLWAEEGTNSITTNVLLTLLLIIFPLLVFLYFALTMWPIIEIDEQGVKKILLRVKIKQYNWSEIRDITIKKSNLSIATWIYFSKTDLKNVSFSRAQIKRDNIKLMLGNLRIIEAVKRYAPEVLKKNVEEYESLIEKK